MHKLTYAAPALAVLTLAAASAPAQTIVGRAVSADGDLNLTSYANEFDPIAGGTDFSSDGDAFAILTVGTDTIPFALLDESVDGFPTDSQGIISEFDTAPFFGIVDTDNPDVAADTPISASFTFDTSSIVGPATVSLDIAAFGDFEDGVNSANFGNTGITAGDFLTIAANGTVLAETAVQAGPDDAEITRVYTLDNGTTNELNDPIDLLIGTSSFELDEDLQTVSFIVADPGDSLTLDFTAYFDAGSEALAFRNLTVAGELVPEPASLALLGLGGLALRRRR